MELSQDPRPNETIEFSVLLYQGGPLIGPFETADEARKVRDERLPEYPDATCQKHIIFGDE